MRRTAVALLIVVIIAGMLVVVAPASAKGHPTGAVALRATFVSGVATQMAPPDGTGETANLVASGTVYVITGPGRTVVVRAVTIAAAPDWPASLTTMPFPLRVPGTYFAWDDGAWNADSSVYTVSGHFFRPNLPPFAADLMADTTAGTMTMTIHTEGSAFGWQQWVLAGELL